ncbi:DUF4189 domain-containing protein [Luteibacter jiangsuensis]|uniref:DUF4189 domain-containing protein n=1 Tax=Luteibacter jiangsuensis TaxID=637577 RepID=A0ABX0QBD9_9GAMM|nr:DUF4189 domain-containing protein [Luteibacter jiangsuensis]
MPLIKLIVALTLMWLSCPVFAEDGCPPGQVPQSGHGWKACVPMGSSPQPTGPGDTFRGPSRVARWTALAFGKSKGILGGGLNKASEDEAILGAMSDCATQGGTDCKIIGAVKNQCIAVAVGTTRLATAEGPTQMTAENQAVTECNKSDSTGCKPYYSTCTDIAYGN